MIAILRQALTRHPFHPVTVTTSDGASIVIENPGFASVLRKAGLLYIELPEEDEPRFISLRLIKEVRARDLAPHDLDDDSREEPPPFS